MQFLLYSSNCLDNFFMIWITGVNKVEKRNVLVENFFPPSLIFLGADKLFLPPYVRIRSTCDIVWNQLLEGLDHFVTNLFSWFIKCLSASALLKTGWPAITLLPQPNLYNFVNFPLVSSSDLYWLCLIFSSHPPSLRFWAMAITKADTSWPFFPSPLWPQRLKEAIVTSSLASQSGGHLPSMTSLFQRSSQAASMEGGSQEGGLA